VVRFPEVPSVPRLPGRVIVKLPESFIRVVACSPATAPGSPASKLPALELAVVLNFFRSRVPRPFLMFTVSRFFVRVFIIRRKHVL